MSDNTARGMIADGAPRGEYHMQGMSAPAHQVLPHTENNVQNGAYSLPGTDFFQYGAFPVQSEISAAHNRGYEYVYQDMVYRSGQTPRRDGPFYRANAASVTAPDDTLYAPGPRGNVYRG